VCTLAPRPLAPPAAHVATMGCHLQTLILHSRCRRKHTGTTKTTAAAPAALGLAPFLGRAASAAAPGDAASAASVAPLLPAPLAQMPAMVPSVPCWAMGGLAPAFSLPAGGFPGCWPAAPPAAPEPQAPAQPSPALLASLQEAMREPTVRAFSLQ